jgi:hypothetical protein
MQSLSVQPATQSQKIPANANDNDYQKQTTLSINFTHAVKKSDTLCQNNLHDK